MIKRLINNLPFYMGAIFFVFLFLIGYLIANRSWDGEYFIHLDNTRSFSNTRNVASIGRQMKVSSSVFRDRKLSHSRALLDVARVEEGRGGVIAIYLGHLLLKSKGGTSVLACQKYQELEMTFIAAGISSHGHAPKMVLKAGCKFDPAQPHQLGPILIPKSEILDSPVDRQLFNIENVTLLFSHVFIKWPEVWTLSKMRFIDSNNPKENLKVSFAFKREKDFLTFRLN